MFTPHLLWPTENLQDTVITTICPVNLVRHTSSNFGTLPGCKMQNEAAVNVVPTSIETTSLLDCPAYGGLRADSSKDTMMEEKGEKTD